MKRPFLFISLILLLAGPVPAANRVDIDVQPTPTDTLRAGEPATLDIYIENDFKLGGMSLGFQVWSPDGATWEWLDVGGLGPITHCVTVTDGRLDPAPGTGSFDMTGLLVTEQDIDEIGRDTIMCGGVALGVGLPVGPLEHMYSYNFIPDIPGPGVGYTLCFDSCFVPPSGAFVFVDPFGQPPSPVTLWPDGGLCVPISNPLYQIAIEKVHDVLQGHFVDVDVCLNRGMDPMGGFDFLIGYDASALTFTEAALGDYFVDCGWEYFTYRYNWNGNCDNACPTGLVRLIGLAETNNGPIHPDWECLSQYEPGEDCHDCGTPIATLTFYVSNDRTLECQFAPIRFYWMDCNDNSISSLSGDTLSVNHRIYDYLGGELGYQEIQDYDYGVPGYYGIPDDPCMMGDKEVPIRFVNFCNGGIDIVCADSIDARGDINVNGVEYEIADAVMLTNYFINGLIAFTFHVENSIAASDVNADGIALSVADLVYLIRVIVGDANPYPKPMPGTEVTISDRGGIIEYNSPVNIGAALLTFRVSGEVGSPQLGAGAAEMDIKYARRGDELRVLVYNIGTKMIAAGENSLLTIPGEVELVGAEVATYEGVGINALIRSLPTEFEISNFPNPFNPKTTIAINLPSASEWSVEIYNVAGQLIRKYAGYAEAGIQSVEWDGSDNNGEAVASGIYLYKVEAGQYSAARKMVLMK